MAVVRRGISPAEKHPFPGIGEREVNKLFSVNLQFQNPTRSRVILAVDLRLTLKNEAQAIKDAVAATVVNLTRTGTPFGLFVHNGDELFEFTPKLYDESEMYDVLDRLQAIEPSGAQTILHQLGNIVEDVPDTDWAADSDYGHWAVVLVSDGWTGNPLSFVQQNFWKYRPYAVYAVAVGEYDICKFACVCDPSKGSLVFTTGQNDQISNTLQEIIDIAAEPCILNCVVEFPGMVNMSGFPDRAGKIELGDRGVGSVTLLMKKTFCFREGDKEPPEVKVRVTGHKPNGERVQKTCIFVPEFKAECGPSSEVSKVCQFHKLTHRTCLKVCDALIDEDFKPHTDELRSFLVNNRDDLPTEDIEKAELVMQLEDCGINIRSCPMITKEICYILAENISRQLETRALGLVAKIIKYQTRKRQDPNSDVSRAKRSRISERSPSPFYLSVDSGPEIAPNLPPPADHEYVASP